MPDFHQPLVLECGKGWRVFVVPVLQDNFVYIACHHENAIVIDAGAAAPVAACLQDHKLALRQVVLTHQHYDHTAGYEELASMIEPTGTDVSISFETLALPGHTPEDVGYYFADARVVCTGDCLINGACGRVLGGSLEDLYQSLQRIKALPKDTLVLGGHDYLVDNLQFALQVQPGNAAIEARLARYPADPAGALFFTLEEEMATNLFLQAEDYAAFASLRRAKDRY